MASDSRFKKVLPLIFGNALEIYDFTLYGLLSVYFSKVFFPQSEHSLFFSFLLFSVAYITRPLGAILWGHIADKYGRKPVLMSTLALMAIPAIGMAFVPSYETIGIAASIIVVFLRFIQGIAFGGEFPTIIVTLYELAPENRKGFYGSFADGGGNIGYLTGLLLVAFLNGVLSPEIMTYYGWRFLFGLSIIFIVVLSYIRSKLTETLSIHKKPRTPFLITIKKDYINILKIILYMFAPSVLFFNFVFHNHLILSSTFNYSALFLQALLVFFLLLIIPLTGFISDKIDRFLLLKVNYVLICFFIIPLYFCFTSENLLLMFFGYLVFIFFVSISVSTVPAVIVPQANKICRVSTVGISYSFAMIIGSFIPSCNEALRILTNTDIAPSFIIIGASILSLSMTFFLKQRDETHV